MSDAPAKPPTDAAQIVAPNAPLREPMRLVGDRKKKFQVIYGHDALASIRSHGRQDTTVEIGGVMVGDIRRDEAGYYLAVTDVIPAAKAASKGTEVTFTAESWEHIQKTMDSQFPNRQIVGWYHTHPGFGVFLSGMDLFIQNNFFNEPHQVALVVDPLGGDEGTFVWRNGECVRENHLIDENVPKLVKRPRGKFMGNVRDNADRLNPRQRVILTLLLFIAALVVGYVLMTYVFPPRPNLNPDPTSAPISADVPTTSPSHDHTASY